MSRLESVVLRLVVPHERLVQLIVVAALLLLVAG